MKPAGTTEGATNALAKRLETMVARAPELAGPAAFYGSVWPVLRAAESGVEPFQLPTATSGRKLGSGQALLVGEDLPLDTGATRKLFLQLCHLLERDLTRGEATSGQGLWPFHKPGRPAHGQTARTQATRQIRRAVEQGDLPLDEVWQALALGAWRRIEVQAGEMGLDPDVLHLLAQTSLKPALRVWAKGLGPAVNLDEWRRGYCPMCGSPPALAEIQGKEGARRLRCGLCGTGWPYPRLQCAFCANTNHKSLGYLSVDGEEEKYRLQTCDDCRGYLKIVVTYDPIPIDELPLEDLATLHLDLIAVEHHFTRPVAR